MKCRALLSLLLLVACGDADPITGRATSAAAYATNGISWQGNGVDFMANGVAWPGHGVSWSSGIVTWSGAVVSWPSNAVGWSGSAIAWSSANGAWSSAALQLSADHGATWASADPSSVVHAGAATVHDGPALIGIVPVPSVLAGPSSCGPVTPGVDGFRFRATVGRPGAGVEGPQLELLTPGGVKTLNLDESATVLGVAVDPAFDLAPLVLRFTRRATLRLDGDQVFEYPIHTAEYCDPTAAGGFTLVGAVLPVPHLAVAPDGRLARLPGAAALVTPPGGGLTPGLPAKIVVYGRVPAPAFDKIDPTLVTGSGDRIPGELFLLHAAIALCNGGWFDDVLSTGLTVRRQVCFTVPGQPIALAAAAGGTSINYAPPLDRAAGAPLVGAFELTRTEIARPDRLDNVSYLPTGWLLPSDVVAGAPTHAASGSSGHRLGRFLDQSPEPRKLEYATQLVANINAVVLGAATGAMRSHVDASALVSARDPSTRRGRLVWMVTSMTPDPHPVGTPPPYTPGSGVAKQCFDDDPQLVCAGSRRALFDRSFHGDCVCDPEEPCGVFDCDADCTGVGPVCQ
jgi:hypothetical protein